MPPPSLFLPQVLAASPKQSMVWGFCKTVSETVTVKFGGSTLSATVGWRAPGVATWFVTLPLTKPGFTPVTIVATSSSGASATIDDVLFGSVFIASGQSNMAYGLNGTNGASSLARSQTRLVLSREVHFSNLRASCNLLDQATPLFIRR
jgi:hypothetical protein